MREVMKAQPPGSESLGSFGEAACMLLRQHKFPFTYEDDEKILSADHDRCFGWDYDHARGCFDRHLKTGELHLPHWLNEVSDGEVMEFLKDILKADSTIVWTGYRVMGTVNRSNGYPVFTFQLFAKRKGSKTKVYSSSLAPNVDIFSSFVDNSGIRIISKLQ